jgi:hypothetical protein
VTWGANPLAKITTIKSADDIASVRDFERFLRDSGFSKKQAVAIASRGYKAVDQSDSDGDVLDSINKLINQIGGR